MGMLDDPTQQLLNKFQYIPNSLYSQGHAMVTNFRFCLAERRGFISVPLLSVGELTVLDAQLLLRLGCKDGATYW